MAITNRLYFVTYQVVAVDPNSSVDSSAYLYRRAAVESLVVAAAQDNATLLAVINPNTTLLAGETIEIVQVEELPLGDRLVMQ